MQQPTIQSVSFEDCRRELIDQGGNAAQRSYARWHDRAETVPGYREVVAFVEGFTHSFLFAITEEGLEVAKARSHHALGSLEKATAQDSRIENFNTPFALHHLFHLYLEQQKQIPAWQDWWEWMTEGGGKHFYVSKVQIHFAWRTLSAAERMHLKDAVQWRLGKFYYSAFRELELFTKLRVRFYLPVKYHILADVLLRTDLWLEKTIVSVFLENTQYRAGVSGRKNRPEYFLDAGFRFVEVTLPRQKYGKFWKIRDEDVASLAKTLTAPSNTLTISNSA